MKKCQLSSKFNHISADTKIRSDLTQSRNNDFTSGFSSIKVLPDYQTHNLQRNQVKSSKTISQFMQRQQKFTSNFYRIKMLQKQSMS